MVRQPNKGSFGVGGRKGGRQKGVPNKANRDIKEAAQKYTQEALDTLVDVMMNAKESAARVAAANALLDRGYGKPRQALDLDPDDKGTFTIVREVITRPA